jgi:hypothetical protein
MQFMQRIWRRQKLVLTLGDEKTQFFYCLLVQNAFDNNVKCILHYEILDFFIFKYVLKETKK